MFDPKTYVETPKITKPADPFTLEAMIAWLKTKDQEETYCYTSTGHCLIAQYLRHHIIQFSGVGAHGYYYGNNYDRHKTPFHEIAALTPYTFGAALQRAIDEQALPRSD